MEEDAAEWYYTTGPDQAGPITFEELKAKAEASELHPRQDMVWKKTMDEWVPAGQIENLFQKRSSESMAESPVPSMTSMEQSKPASPQEVILWPGPSRRWYFLFVIIFPILWVVISLAFATFVGPKLSPGFEKMFLLLGVIVPIWVVVDTSLGRLSNLGMNKLFIFLHFVPVVNVWLGFRSFACPAGYAKTKKLDAIGWFLAIIYWLFVIACVACAILIPAVLATTLKDSEIMEKFQLMREQIESSDKGNSNEQPEESDELAPAP